MLNDGNMGSTKKKHGHGFASKNMYLEIAKSMQKIPWREEWHSETLRNEKVRLRGRSTWKVFKNLGSKRSIGDILHVEKRR